MGIAGVGDGGKGAIWGGEELQRLCHAALKRDLGKIEKKELLSFEVVALPALRVGCK